MSDIINTNHKKEEIGLYTEALFPEIEQYIKNIDNLKTQEIVDTIKLLDKKAVAFYYSKNTKKSKNGKQTILNKEFADLVYDYNHYTYKDNKLLKEVLKKILKQQINAIKDFLEAWDLQASGTDFAIEKKLIETLQKDIKTYKPRQLKNNYNDEIIRLAEKLAKNNKVSDIVTNIQDFGKFKITDTIDYIKSNIDFTIAKEVLNSEIFYALLLVFSLYNLPKFFDYIDGYNYSLTEYTQNLKKEYGEDSKRQIKIIEEKIFPIISKSISKINLNGFEVNYDDFSNKVFFYGTDPENGMVNLYIDIDSTEKNYKIGELSSKELTKMGLGSSKDFILKYINHPDNLKKLKIMSEIDASKQSK